MPATVTNIKDAAEKRDRIAAFHVGESVLHIYEEFFPYDMRLRLLLSSVKPEAAIIVAGPVLDSYRYIAQDIRNDAAFVAITTELPEANDIYSAIMVADIVVLCLEPEICLEAIEVKAFKVMSAYTKSKG